MSKRKLATRCDPSESEHRHVPLHRYRGLIDCSASSETRNPRAPSAPHQTLLRDAVAENGGYEVDAKVMGFFFAFSGARSALTACGATAVALQAECWPDEVGLAVRMGLHTGEAEFRRHEQRRLRGASGGAVSGVAQGGQVLVPRPTEAAVHEALPASTSLRDLGSPRWSLTTGRSDSSDLPHPGMRGDFPRCRSPPSRSAAARARRRPGPARRRPLPAIRGDAAGSFRIPGDIGTPTSTVVETQHALRSPRRARTASAGPTVGHSSPPS